MKRRLGLAITVAAMAVGTGCANQSNGAAPVRPTVVTSPLASVSAGGSWVGPQRNPGVDSSWAGPQTVAGLNNSWVGAQAASGLDSSWAGPQVTATTAATAVSSAAAPPHSSAASVATSTPSSIAVDVAADFEPATPELAAAVTAAIGRTEAAYDRAARDLDNPALRDVLAATTAAGSAAQELFLGWYDFVVDEGYWYEPSADGENTTTLMPGAVINVDASGQVAIAQVCAVSGDTIFDHDQSGAEVVVGSGWTADEMTQIFLLTPDGAQWLLTDQINLETHPGERTCAEPTSSSVPSASSPGSSPSGLRR